MFSPELMRFILKYQDKEFLPKEKSTKKEPTNRVFTMHKLATIPIKSKY